MRNEVKLKIQTSLQDQIDLGGMQIEDNELQAIVREIIKLKPKLNDLFLNNNKIGDEGAKIIGREFESLKHLHSLDLQFNQIDEVGAKAIYRLKKNNPHLKIAFHGNKIFNASIMHAIENSATK